MDESLVGLLKNGYIATVSSACKSLVGLLRNGSATYVSRECKESLTSTVEEVLENLLQKIRTNMNFIRLENVKEIPV